MTSRAKELPKELSGSPAHSLVQLAALGPSQLGTGCQLADDGVQVAGLAIGQCHPSFRDGFEFRKRGRPFTVGLFTGGVMEDVDVRIAEVNTRLPLAGRHLHAVVVHAPPNGLVVVPGDGEDRDFATRGGGKRRTDTRQLRRRRSAPSNVPAVEFPHPRPRPGRGRASSPSRRSKWRSVAVAAIAAVVLVVAAMRLAHGNRVPAVAIWSAKIPPDTYGRAGAWMQIAACALRPDGCRCASWSEALGRHEGDAHLA